MATDDDFGFGEEEQILRDHARRLLGERASLDALRALVAPDAETSYRSDPPPAPWDDALWRQMVGLGWPGLIVPSEAGGSGLGIVALVALCEEIGRAALPSPLSSTLLATCVLRAAKTPPANEAMRRIAAGASATLAVTDARGSWSPHDTDVVAVAAGGDETRLQGTASFVQDARKASSFVVSAKGADGVGLYGVDADAPGVSVRPDRIADLSRDQARVELDGVPVAADRVVAPPGSGDAVLARALPALLAALAADICGAAEWQLQTTTEYARVRVQFDHPLGFFQAVKHPLVNLMIDVDRARSLTYGAAHAIDRETDDALRLARMAKSAASDLAAFASSRSIQLHGGIGFTWEHAAHIYFKRQRHSQVLCGDGVVQRAEIAGLL